MAFTAEDTRPAESLSLRPGSSKPRLRPKNQVFALFLGKTSNNAYQNIPQHRNWSFAVKPRFSDALVLDCPTIERVEEIQRFPRAHASDAVQFPDENDLKLPPARRIQQCLEAIAVVGRAGLVINKLHNLKLHALGVGSQFQFLILDGLRT